MQKNTIQSLVIAAICLAFAGGAFADVPKREMNVRKGPETVFDKPVSEIVPELAGAKVTRRNGRVGNEFVFWGYTLSDGTPANFYACAAVQGVDCIARRAQICTNSTKVISENQSMGNVEKRSCRVLCSVGIPTSTPCCTSVEESADLQIGVVTCGD